MPPESGLYEFGKAVEKIFDKEYLFTRISSTLIQQELIDRKMQ